MANTIGFLLSDGGRAASGRKGTASDCVVRAASLLLGHRQGLDLTDQGTADWGALYDSLYGQLAVAAKTGRGGRRSARNGLYKADYEPVFKSWGIERLSLGRGTKPTFGTAWRFATPGSRS